VLAIVLLKTYLLILFTRLMSRGPCVDASSTARDFNGMSVVHHAAVGGRKEAVVFLLDPITLEKGVREAPDLRTFTRCLTLMSRWFCISENDAIFLLAETRARSNPHSHL